MRGPRHQRALLDRLGVSAAPALPARIGLPRIYRPFVDALEESGDWVLIEPYGCGNLTSVMISPSFRAVVNMPSKNLSAAMSRLLVTIVAPEASAAAG